MIDWKKHPKATRAIVNYLNDDDKSHVAKETFTRPTQKTVADAAEQEPHFKATRENLDKIAKDAQGDFVEVEEGEKWTHVDSDGNKCRILHAIGEQSWVTYKNSSYEDELWPSAELRVIKPTISEAQAWRKAVLAGNMQNITDNYNVVAKD